ncbi:MAG TPA: putative glycolipid-binding domain-containing protein [Acidimicrobiales bacterium]
MKRDDRLGHHVLWHCAELASSEHAWLVDDEEGHKLAGVAALPLDDAPCHISYEVMVDHQWAPLAATATVTTAVQVSTIALVSVGQGRWTLDATPSPLLDGCGDVDLGWTPATNTIPIRRLALEVGETAPISAAWVRFPELDVVTSEQRYTRLGDGRWRYQSGDYDFELRTDVATGLVLAYGDDLWRVAAMAVGRPPT